MKKIGILALILILLTTGTVLAFGESTVGEISFRGKMGMFRSNNMTNLSQEEWEELNVKREEFRLENKEYNLKLIEEAYSKGELSQEEYEDWIAHINRVENQQKVLEEFREENRRFFEDAKIIEGMRGFGRRGMKGANSSNAYCPNL